MDEKERAKTPKQTLEDNARKAIDHALSALPRHIDRDRWDAIIMSLVRTNADTLVKCEATSVMLAIYAGARLGLDFDPALGHAYIVPRWMNGATRATFMPGYRGLIELGRRSGRVGSVTVGIVRDGDQFDEFTDEHGRHILHRPQQGVRRVDRPPTAYYSVAHMTGDHIPMIHVMTIDEVQEHEEKYAPRDRKTKQVVGPWVANFDAMALKSTVRMNSKLWPLSPQLAMAVQLDEQAERGELQQISGVDRDKLIEPPTGRMQGFGFTQEASQDEPSGGDDEQTAITAGPDDAHRKPKQEEVSVEDQRLSELVGVVLDSGNNCNDIQAERAVLAWLDSIGKTVESLTAIEIFKTVLALAKKKHGEAWGIWLTKTA